MKTSVASTEFLTLLGSGGALFNGFNDTDWKVRVASLIVFGLVSSVYIWSRTKIKTTEE